MALDVHIAPRLFGLLLGAAIASGCGSDSEDQGSTDTQASTTDQETGDGDGDGDGDGGPGINCTTLDSLACDVEVNCDSVDGAAYEPFMGGWCVSDDFEFLGCVAFEDI